MSEEGTTSEESAARPLYAQILPNVVCVFLPKRYKPADVTTWINVIDRFLDGHGYTISKSPFTDDAEFSVRPTKVLKIFYTPRSNVEQKTLQDRTLIDLLNTKYATAVYARVQNFFDTDGDRVCSQVRLALIPEAPCNVHVAPEKEWLGQQRITHKISNSGNNCFTLPGDIDPNSWKLTIANALNAFLMTEEAIWD